MNDVGVEGSGESNVGEDCVGWSIGETNVSGRWGPGCESARSHVIEDERRMVVPDGIGYTIAQ